MKSIQQNQINRWVASLVICAVVATIFPIHKGYAEELPTEEASSTEEVEVKDIKETTGESVETPTEATDEEDVSIETASEESVEDEIKEETESDNATSTDVIMQTLGGETIAPDDNSSSTPPGISSSTEEFVLEGSTTEASSTIVILNGTSTTATSTPVTIQSGDAVALANIINIVNTNFVNSDGVVFFSNFLEAVAETLDLRRLYNSVAGFGCTLLSCNDDSTTVNLSNDAAIENFLLLQAMTGSNLIENAGSGAINTGNAYAGLNLVNVANMNFVDSNYLLVTINAFDDVNGDIVFPSASSLLSNLAYSPESAQIDITNNANVTNGIEVGAHTGNNSLNTFNGGSISTGSSGASSNVFNQLNTSLIGGQNVTILFRIHGNWAGEVFGAPDDLAWQQGPDGSVMLFDTNGGSGSYNTGSVNVNATNNASINNQVKVVALTGDNRISNAETGAISTGNALAGANIVNLVNGNVVGRNWILAIVNIFGDFKGNIAFGRPDLWVGEIVSAPEKIRDGSTINYKFTVLNNGDSPASRVTLLDSYASSHLRITDSSVPYTVTADGKLKFDIGTLPPGGGTEISYNAVVVGVGDQRKELTNTVSVSARETDNNMRDNTDTATIVTSKKSSGSSVNSNKDKETKRKEITNKELIGEVAGITADISGLKIARMFPRFPLTPTYPSMRQVVVLSNDTNAVIPAVQYVDVLRDANGAEVQREVWDLGDVMPGEEIELGYTLAFKVNAAPGTYTLASYVKSGVSTERYYENGVITFTTTAVNPEDLTGIMETITKWQPALKTILPGITAYAASEDVSDLSQTEQELLLPTLSAHSMSTATRQQDGQGGFMGLLARLYAYLSSLVSMVASEIVPGAFAQAKVIN